ncbi:MAG: prefoldin subunit alpha [Thaumarchaeota archaeon]|nr:prefoldin subunit alpha [Nitrososphaerota archaeon]
MSQERAQQLYEQVTALESQYSEILRQEAMLGTARREAISAAETLRGTAGGKALEALVPVGAGLYLGARVDDPDRVIVDIGAGVAMERDRASALDHVEAQIKGLDVALGNAADQKRQIAAQLQQGRQELEGIARAEMGAPGGNV